MNKTLLENLANLLKVKTLITLAVVTALVYGFAVGKIDSENFMLVAIMVVTYYFNKKDSQEMNTTETTTITKEETEV